MQRHGHDTVAEYIRSFQKGEQKGFNFLFREFYAALTWYSFQITDSRPVAEEIASETMLKLWERHSGFDSINAIKSFLYTTTRNSSISWLRRQKTDSKKVREIALVLEKSEKTVLTQMLETEFYRSVFTAISTLPPQCRTIFRMLFIEGKDYKETARELNLSPSTIRNQKARAIQLLRQRIVLGISGIATLLFCL